MKKKWFKFGDYIGNENESKFVITKEEKKFNFISRDIVEIK